MKFLCLPFHVKIEKNLSIWRNKEKKEKYKPEEEYQVQKLLSHSNSGNNV